MTGARRFTPFTAFIDMLLCVVVVILTMVATKKSADDPGVKFKAEYIISAEWSVDVDADVDLWVIPPGGAPLFYNSREVGAMHLDRDSRGFMDNVLVLPDGRKVKSLSAKEIATMRGVVPGHYDVGVHLYQARQDGAQMTGDHLGIKVRVEVVKVNPDYDVVKTEEVALDRVWQTINVASFDLDEQGHATFVDPPLEPVTARYYLGRPQP